MDNRGYRDGKELKGVEFSERKLRSVDRRTRRLESTIAILSVWIVRP